MLLASLREKPGRDSRWTHPDRGAIVAHATIALATILEVHMFTVRVAVKVRPDGRDAFLAQLGKETREVPSQFVGCERFELFVDPADPQRVFLYEEWRDRDAAQVYMDSEYFTQSGEVLFPLMDGKPDSAYYESERVGP